MSFFWGLKTTDAATKNCPVGLYYDGSTIKVWNKVKIYFKVGADFPTGDDYVYKITVTTVDAVAIPIGSVNTNLKAHTGNIACTFTAGSSGTLECANLARVTSGNKWIAFSMNIATGASAGFGTVKFSQKAKTAADSTYKAITGTTSPAAT